jgi:hypothetical protein
MNLQPILNRKGAGITGIQGEIAAEIHSYCVVSPRSVLEKFSAMQMIDVHLPTTDRREVILTRYTQPEPEVQMLLKQLRLSLPQPAAPSGQPCQGPQCRVVASLQSRCHLHAR